MVKDVKDGIVMAVVVIIVALWLVAAIIAPSALIKFCWAYLRG